jgi:hypothetical protein
MNPHELSQDIDLMLDDASAIIHNQQILKGIHSEINKHQLNPFEIDEIYRERYGEIPSEPRIISVNGVEIMIKVLHQTGAKLSDVNGADLLYEIDNEKYTLLQYKRIDSNKAAIDKNQLSKMLNNCPDICSNKGRRPLNWLPSKVFSFCGFWYVFLLNGERKYIPTCEVETMSKENTLDKNRIIDIGISKLSYLELFSNCRIGALLRKQDEKEILGKYITRVLEINRIIINIIQKGKWQRKEDSK